MNKDKETYLEITKHVKLKFGTWANFSKILGYENNSAGLFFKDNIRRLNKKLAKLGLEIIVKKI